ncbi:MAG: hypothetical protein JW793_07065 [Acidobacteria bacterium]|nr:hypothetical protein [Acidobacteriota bacterium]
MAQENPVSWSLRGAIPDSVCRDRGRIQGSIWDSSKFSYHIISGAAAGLSCKPDAAPSPFEFPRGPTMRPRAWLRRLLPPLVAEPSKKNAENELLETILGIVLGTDDEFMNSHDWVFSTGKKPAAAVQIFAFI